jgi:hypothetical protein
MLKSLKNLGSAAAEHSKTAQLINSEEKEKPKKTPVLITLETRDKLKIAAAIDRRSMQEEVEYLIETRYEKLLSKHQQEYDE